MSKFIAMLKDSYKEAVDGWIFLVMAIMAGLLIVLVASLGATPLPADEAVPKLFSGRDNGGRFVSADRGQAAKLAIFTYQQEVTDIATGPAGAHPWDGEVRFTVKYAGFGIPGVPVGAEVDDAKQPKKVEKIDDGGALFANPFQEAVRYWAAPPGTPAKDRPAYTDELAKEFVAAQMRDVARLNATGVEKVKGPGSQFRVTATGTDRVGWPHRPSLFFGAWTMDFLTGPLGDLIYLVENGLVNQIGAWVLLLTGVVVTAGFIPNMLRKGAIDLLLTKPLSRPLILLYKYLGGLLFVFLLTAVTVGGVWVMVGLKTGVWAPGLLYAIGGITFYFAILYSVSTLAGVLTRNAIVCIVVTVSFWGLLFLIGIVYSTVNTLNNVDFSAAATARPAAKAKKDVKPAAKGDKDADKKDDAKEEDAAPPPPPQPPKPPEWLVDGAKYLNMATPRTNDLDAITQRLIGQDLLSPATQHQAGLKRDKLNWGEVLSVAGAYIALFLGLATVRFVTRSY